MTMHRSSLRRPPRSLCKSALLLVVATVGAGGCQKEETLPVMMMGPPGGMTPMGMMPPGGMTPMTPPTSSPPPAGAANVKFCNAINGPSGPIKVSLTLGGLKLEAMSGTCAPDSGCQSMTAGNARLSFTMDNKEVFAQEIGVESGQQYLVVATVDRASQKVQLGGGKLPPQAACASANPFPMGSQPTEPGPGPNQAVGKFCHGLSVQGSGEVELELMIGTVSMKARTGGCSVPDGAACTSLPVGNHVASLLFEGAEQARTNVTIEGGKQYLIDLDVSPAGMPTINVEALPAGVACTAAGGGSAPPPQPPPPPGSTTEVKLCNRLPAGSGTAEISIGNGVTLMAAPGQCAPMRGTMCPKVPAGPTMLELSIDGNPLGMGTANLPAGAVSLNLRPNAGSIGVQVQTIPAGMMCAAFEAN